MEGREHTEAPVRVGRRIQRQLQRVAVLIQSRRLFPREERFGFHPSEPTEAQPAAVLHPLHLVAEAITLRVETGPEHEECDRCEQQPSPSAGRGGESLQLDREGPKALRRFRRVHDHKLTREVNGAGVRWDRRILVGCVDRQGT